MKNVGIGYEIVESTVVSGLLANRIIDSIPKGSILDVSLAAFKDGINWGATASTLKDEIRIKNIPKKLLGKHRM